MNARFLLDTHIVVWWLVAPTKISREQARIVREAIRQRESLALSAMTLLEIAVLVDRRTGSVSVPELLADLKSNDVFEILPITIEVADEVAALGSSLRDPGDRAIVATARVHKLRLLTSDQRIIASKLVPVIA